MPPSQMPYRGHEFSTARGLSCLAPSLRPLRADATRLSSLLRPLTPSKPSSQASSSRPTPTLRTVVTPFLSLSQGPVVVRPSSQQGARARAGVGQHALGRVTGD